MLILYAFKITNNLYSGIWSSLSLYYLLRCVDYFQNYWIVFTLALVILSGVIKSIILLSLRKYWNKTFSFYVGVLLNLIPLMLVKYCCFS